MKKLLFIILLFVILYSFNILCFADEAETVQTSQEVKFDVQGVIDNPDSTELELLRAILVCLKDIDVYVQFFVTLVFAIGLVYFVLFKPIRYFLI